MLSMAGVPQRTLQLEAAYGLQHPQGISTVPDCWERHPLLVMACESCALVMTTGGLVMQRLMVGAPRLGCVMCNESHVFVSEYETGSVWRLTVW